jgi:transcriptional regulator with XRE-family HTH domain
LKYLAKNLKWLREKAGLKQRDLPGAIGFKSTTWNNYEKGVSKPGLDDLIKISKYFGVTETELLHEDLQGKNLLSGPKPFSEKNIFHEEEIEYKKISELKDKIIRNKEKIIASQQGELDSLRLQNQQLKSKIKETGGKKK